MTFRQPTIEEKEAALAGRRVDRRYSVSTFTYYVRQVGTGEACTDSPSSFESEDDSQLC
jgi:hypothetical protein